MRIDIKAKQQAKMALALCMQAKNATLTLCGVTREQTVFGRPLRWLPPATNEAVSFLLLASGSDGPSWLKSQVRTAARVALLE